MFKKKPQIKNLAPLKSSDRRKLADQIRRDYQIQEPPNDTQEATNGSQDGSAPQTQTLTGLRNTLLPDPTSSAKFTTTHGPDSKLVSGTVYVGAYPGQEERILWFQFGKDERLIPTVYSLWHNPGLLPLLHIGESIVGKLQGGADLFAPGVIKPDHGFDERAITNSIVAVAGHKTDTVPRWVGVSKQDIAKLGDSAKGAAAEGLHWEGDELWLWSAKGTGGTHAPETIEGWQGLTEVEPNVKHLNLDDDGPEPEHIGGGVAIEDNAEREEEDEYIPTTKEVDDAFVQAFLYSVYTAKKTHQSFPYGFDFPIQPSFLISKMIHPYLRHQTSHYNIKKTSWKNAKKFIKHLDKQVLLKSKDRNGGETVILDIDFNDEQVNTFQPYKLPKPKPVEEESTTQPDSDQSLNQRLTLQHLYRASSKLVPDLLPSKTIFYTAQQITAAIKAYIDTNNLVSDNKRYVKLDPFIANNILNANDVKALKAGEIDRAALNKRIIDDDHLCNPYHVLLRNDQSLADAKPKPGSPPKVTVTIERRTGSKTVTAIVGLEAFFINPMLIRSELQKKCAGSASVGQHVGGKPGMMEVSVQGDQRGTIEKEILIKRGVKPEWIDVVDKTKKKK